MRSLRRRLFLGTALGTALVLVTIGVCLYLVMRASLLAEFDGALVEKARTLAGLIEQDGQRVELEFAEVDMAEFSRPQRPEYYQIWLADGTVLSRSPSLNGRDLPRVGGSLQSPAVGAIELPDGRPGRIVGLTDRPRFGDESAPGAVAQEITLVLARDVLDVNGTLAGLRLLLAGACVAGTVLSLGILAVVVRRGLSPVGRLAAEIAQIDETNLSGRIDEATAPREMARIVQRLNDLLQRLEAAFSRERTLTADVAHELRTPLAGLRSTLEVALSQPREGEQYRQAMESCLDICRQTQAMAENLLALARLDAGCWEISARPVDLSALLRETWGSLTATAEARRLRARWTVDGPTTANTDEAMLRSLLHNVLENAVIHANEGGEVRIKCVVVEPDVLIRVENTGSRIADHDAERVFERFWRGDAARHAAGAHCGLGLSLSRRIVECLGGSIRADSARGGVFSITAKIPMERGTPAESEPSSGTDW